MSTQEELLPCPFCGGEAKPPEEQTAGYWVECTECKSRGSRCFFEIAAISAWNRRASPPANAEPVAYLIEGNVSRTRYLQFEPEVAECDQPLVTVSKLYLASPPAAVPDGWEPTPDMVEAARSVVRQILVDAAYEFRADRRKSSAMFAAEVLVSNAMANAIKAAMISAAPAAPTEARDE